jgi:hypothetical protein
MTALPLLVLVCMTGCVRRDGCNSDCRWPGESVATRLDLSQPWHRRHLSQDAELAGDPAIRYPDTSYGLRSGPFESREAAKPEICVWEPCLNRSARGDADQSFRVSRTARSIPARLR